VAEVVVDGERRRGTVAVGSDTSVPPGAILRVVETEEVPPVLGVDDRLVTQIVCTPPPEARKCYDELRAGAAVCGCAPKIARMDSLYRTELLTALLVERMQDKTARIARIFDNSESDWNQTFLSLLMTAMGGDRNREAFAALAAKVTSAMVSREKGSTLRVEALLLGAAGFLFNTAPDNKDEYTRSLEVEARHLLAKYSIVPLRPGVWSLGGLYPANHPAVRLAEIAALICKKDFMLDGVLNCRTSEDVERLFDGEASEYWRTHYKPSDSASRPSAKRIGREKARLLGINLAAPLMFAYGRATEREELCERALDLLATIPAERNGKLDGWYEGGCTPESGFESQAILQLAVRYCAGESCTACRLGRMEIKKSLVCDIPTIYS
jgi:hypothetical protein